MLIYCRLQTFLGRPEDKICVLVMLYEQRQHDIGSQERSLSRPAQRDAAHAHREQPYIRTASPIPPTAAFGSKTKQRVLAEAEKFKRKPQPLSKAEIAAPRNKCIGTGQAEQ